MAKLIFMFDGNVLGEYELNKERLMIGRRGSNDVHIDNLAVSGQHAAVVKLGEDYFLEDLNSTNGTFVNKKRIKKHVLQHQDVIELGKYQLKFVGKPAQQAGALGGFVNTVTLSETAPVNRPVPVPQPKLPKTETVESTQVISPLTPQLHTSISAETKPGRPKPMEMMPIEPLEKTSSSQESSSAVAEETQQSLGDAIIKIISGNDAGVEVRLNKTMVKLGRYGEQLAVVTKRPNGYYLTHVDGKTHPLVNGQAIGVHAHPLNAGDLIEIAGDKMQFVYEASN